MVAATTLAGTALQFFLVGTLAAMAGAFVWASGRLLSGQPLLPDRPPPLARWGKSTVLLVLLAYLLIQMTVGTLVVLASDGAGKEPPNLAKLPAPGLDAPPVVKNSKPAPAEQLSMTERMLAVTFINVMTLILVPALVRWTSGARLADLGLSLAEFPKNATVGLVAFLVVTPWVYVAFALARLVYSGSKHPLESMLRQESSPLAMVLAVVSAVIAAPLAEELLFRGVLQTWLNQVYDRSRASARTGLTEGPTSPETAAGPEQIGWTAGEQAEGREQGGFPGLNTMAESEPILAGVDDPETSQCKDGASPAPRSWIPVGLTSVMFAAVHYTEMPAPIAIFFLSMALGWVYQRTGTLVAPIVLHALFNALSTVQLLLTLK